MSAARRVDLLRTLVRSVRREDVVPALRVRHRCRPGECGGDDGAARSRVAPTASARIARRGPFNFSRKINSARRRHRGAICCCFNDDVEVISPEWMSAMLENAQEPAIGAVGAKLLYPDGRLQHIGIVLGVAGLAAHAFHQHPGASPGYFGSAIMPRNYSAVTAACMMTRREVFDQVGGFDERLAIDFNDVDYCLRLRRAGYRVVFTPWAELYHHESASFGARTGPRPGRRDAAALGGRHRSRSVLQSQPDPRFSGLPSRCVTSIRLHPTHAAGGPDGFAWYSSSFSGAWSSCRW